MVSVFLTDIVFSVLLGNYFLIRGISIIRTEKRLWLWMTVTESPNLAAETSHISEGM